MDNGKILIVDDSKMNVNMLLALLEDTPYSILTSANGEDALKAYPDFQPDIILLDIIMPGIDGYEVCKRLREEYDCHCKIIFFSAKYDTADRIRAYEVGGDDYITKPFNEVELLHKLKVFMRLQSSEVIEAFKSELLQFLTHEINTPLNAMMPSLQLLKRAESLTLEEIKAISSIAYDGANKLNDLFDKVKFLMLLRNGEWSFSPETINLYDLTSSIVDTTLIEEVNEKRIINVKLPQQLHLNIDKSTMNFVISSLVDNALKYSFIDKRIEIYHQINQEGDISLCVRNWPDKSTNALKDTNFSAFAHDELLYHSSGHGLSLSICDQIIKHHNATLSCVNLKDKSISFNITFPKSAIFIQAASS